MSWPAHPLAVLPRDLVPEPVAVPAQAGDVLARDRRALRQRLLRVQQGRRKRERERKSLIWGKQTKLYVRNAGKKRKKSTLILVQFLEVGPLPFFTSFDRSVQFLFFQR